MMAALKICNGCQRAYLPQKHCFSIVTVVKEPILIWETKTR